MRDRRWIGGILASLLVALLAFAPFRDTGTDAGTGIGIGAGAPSSTTPDVPGTDGSNGATSEEPASVPLVGPSGTTGAGTDAPSSSAGDPAPTTAPDDAPLPAGAPSLPEPTDAELAVLGPLIAAMDKGQAAGTPLVLGIATAIVATGIPAESDVPPELQPVVQALAELIALPGSQVNDVTAQNSVQLAALDRALGELAFANPAVNATIHQVAAALATMGRAADAVSPPGGVALRDLSTLLDYFVVG